MQHASSPTNNTFSHSPPKYNMRMISIWLFLALSTLLLSSSTCHAIPEESYPLIQMLRPRSGSGGHRLDGLDCLSWRLAVETNNLRDWKLVPESCEGYVGNYMLGDQYRKDCELVAEAAIEYAESLKLAGDGKDAWVFDIDETTLSNLPYYARSDVMFGAIAYNSTKFHEWVKEGTTPALPAVLRLYKKLLSLGFKTIFLTGLGEAYKDIRAMNLKKVGYRNWEKLIFKTEADRGMPAVEYKSKKRTELVSEGYRILGNTGDQWSDLLGPNPGGRTFKVPDPMYYIG